jgi:hypothetical protein
MGKRDEEGRILIALIFTNEISSTVRMEVQGGERRYEVGTPRAQTLINKEIMVALLSNTKGSLEECAHDFEPTNLNLQISL